MSAPGPGLRASLLFAWRGWILAALFAVIAVARIFSDAPLRPPALALLILGAAWRLQAGRFILAHSNGLRMEAGPLAFSGPYAMGRHPLYLSNLVSAAGIILFANCLPLWAMASLFAAVCLHHGMLAYEEEEHMLSVHGESYRSYMRDTPRWLGMPRKRAAAHTADPDAGSFTAGFKRQGGNLAKTGAAAILLWGLARL